MPIRFRCVYCNQLLGIAHRKAGTVVRCPTCAGQVVVPSSEASAATEKTEADSNEPFLFEQNDFDQVFIPGAIASPAKQAPSSRGGNGPALALVPQPGTEVPAGAWGTHAEPPFDVERIDMTATATPGTSPAGIFLSPTKATVLCVVGIVSLVLAFGIGLVVGLRMATPSPTQPPEPPPEVKGTE